MNLRRVYIGVGLLAALAVIAIFIASPWMAAARLSRALRSGDPVEIERMVDFPSVRAGLASQITDQLNARLANNPEVRDNPFAGLLTMLAPAAINQALNAVVTPQGLAKLSREAETARRASRHEGKRRKARRDEEPAVRPVLAYTGLNTFTATYDNPDKGRMVWVLGREKLFFWKLKKIEVSDVVIEDLNLER